MNVKMKWMQLIGMVGCIACLASCQQKNFG